MPVTLNGSTGLQFNDGTVQSTVAYSPWRNRIINGDMRIDQRNNGAAVTPASGQYLVDRFFYGATQASKFTAQRNAGAVTPPVGFTNYLGLTVTSAVSVAAGDTFYFGQTIEGLNVADLGWGTANAQPVTISFVVRSSIAGTHSGCIGNAAFVRTYPFSYTINSANTWEVKTITVAGDTTGTWATDNTAGLSLMFNLGSGSNFTGAAGAWAAVTRIGVTGATSVVGTSGATFYITGVQLEAGSVATPFERVEYGEMLRRCQRYFETLNGGTVKAAGYGTAGAEGSRQYYGFAVTKRASPTMSFPTAGVANCNLASNSAVNGFNVTATVISTGSFGYDFSSGTVAASAEL